MTKRSAENEELLDDASNYNRDAYQKAAHTVDVIICRIFEGELETLLIKRKNPPFKNKWAICGGFVRIAEDEGLEQAAQRKLFEEIGVKKLPVRQLATYGDDTKRDPRDRIISTVYFALVSEEVFDQQVIRPNQDAAEAKWVNLRKARNLAFDHRTILNDFDLYMRERIVSDDLAFGLVNKRFTWSELRSVYETVLDRPLIAQNFPRDIKHNFLVNELDETKSVGRGKPAKLCVYQGRVSRFR